MTSLAKEKEHHGACGPWGVEAGEGGGQGSSPTPHSSRPTSDYASVDDLSLPRQRTRREPVGRGDEVEVVGGGGELRERSNSEGSLHLSPPPPPSTLTLDRRMVSLASVSTVTVAWDIRQDVSAQDWIGLFPAGQNDASKFWDCKNRGRDGGQSGQIIWDLAPIAHCFPQPTTEVCFKYFLASSGQVVATSPTLLVKNPQTWRRMCSSMEGSLESGRDKSLYRLLISDLSAVSLKKGMFFNPDPYVKMWVHPGPMQDRLPHHSQECRTPAASSTTSPHWEGEVLSMDAMITDVVEFEVKDKFSKSRLTMSRFLGKTSLAVQRVLDRVAQGTSPVEFNLDLTRRSPTDTVSGSLHFRAQVQLLLSGLGESASRCRLQQRKTSLPADLIAGTTCPTSKSPRTASPTPTATRTQAWCLPTAQGATGTKTPPPPAPSPARPASRGATWGRGRWTVGVLAASEQWAWGRGKGRGYPGKGRGDLVQTHLARSGRTRV